MAQLFPVTQVSYNGRADARSLYLNAGKCTITDAEAPNTQIQYDINEKRIDTIVVSDSYATVHSYLGQYAGGVGIQVALLSINNKSVVDTVTIRVDDIHFAYANPDNANQTYLIIYERNNNNIYTYLVNNTIASIVSAANTTPLDNGHVIQDEGVTLAQRDTLNFVGTGVTVTDTGTKTEVSISSGASQNFANANLTFDADHSHDLDGFALTITSGSPLLAEGFVLLNGVQAALGSETIAIGGDAVQVISIGRNLVNAGPVNSSILIGEFFASTNGSISIGVGATAGTIDIGTAGSVPINIGTSSTGDISIGNGAAGNTLIEIGDTSVTNVNLSGDTLTLNAGTQLTLLGAGTPGAGKVLTSDASGNATWETAGGGSAITLKTSITSLEVLDLANTPIDVTPAPTTPGNYIKIIDIVAKLTYNTTSYNNASDETNLRFIYNGADGLAAFMNSFLNADQDRTMNAQIGFATASPGTTQDIMVADAQVQVTTFLNPTLGDSDIDIYVTYEEVTLA